MLLKKTPVCVLLAALVVMLASLPASRGVEAPVVRWQVLEGRHVVEVSGLEEGSLKFLARDDPSGDVWKTMLRVAVGKEDAPPPPDRTPMAGTYQVDGSTLRFRPRYALEPGLTYWATFDPSKLTRRAPAGLTLSPLTAKLRLEEAAPSARTRVVRVDPETDSVPENLLKFYLTFSGPMSRGQAYDHVRLLDASGKPIDMPFLELGEELWDPTETRLTLLIDPGRIKTGLRPRVEEGTVLKAGEPVTIVVDTKWLDAQGQPLENEVRKTYRVGPPDPKSPDPASWKIQPPRGGTRGPLTLAFPEPLDRALLERLIAVQDEKGQAIAGTVRVVEHQTRWQFEPAQPWSAGRYRVVIGTELEDLAGNSIERPFEVDLFQVERRGDGPSVKTLWFEVSETAKR